MPSAVRGARYAGAWPDSGIAVTAKRAPAAAATTAIITPVNVFRTWNTPPAGEHTGCTPLRMSRFYKELPKTLKRTVDTEQGRSEYQAHKPAGGPQCVE